MSAFLKNSLKIATVLFVVGLVIAVIGAVLGGKIVNIEFNKTSDFKETYTNVESIDIEIGASNIEVREGDEFKIDATNILTKRFKSYVENGVWHIEQKASFNFLGFNSKGSKIIVYLPKDFVSRKLSIEVGAANFKADKLISNNAKITVGAGSVKIDEFITDNLDIECGVGNIDINGVINKNLDAQCGVGQINLDLIGKEEDYNYNFDVGLGEIELNNMCYTGIRGKTIDNGAKNKKFNVEVGIGKVNIEINE